jgi:uncharacterized membrane protein
MLSDAAAIAATITLALIGGMAGLFSAFSISVMPDLDAVKLEQAIRAMQSMNRKTLNPVFLPIFTGTPLAAAGTGGLLLRLDRGWAAILFLLAAATYVLGTVLPTIAVNVPMNEALAAEHPVWLTLLWVAILLAIFAPLGCGGIGRRAGRRVLSRSRR